MRIIVWGAGRSGQELRKYIETSTSDEFMGFIDNNSQLGGVIRPSEIREINYDVLIVSNIYEKDRNEIKKQIATLDIDMSKLIYLAEDNEWKTKVFSEVNHYDEKTNPRVLWLKAYAGYVKHRTMRGNVAECGVCRGEFAYYINKFFPDRKLYLMDTFDGFPESDLQVERRLGQKAFLEGKFNREDIFRSTNIEIVKRRMPHLKQCEFCVGYFPDSAKEVIDEFCFVNLDTDLYKPILSGLEFFLPKMVEGGIILIHDYFNPELPGVAKAINDYEEQNDICLHKFPIADFCSLAIIK